MGELPALSATAYQIMAVVTVPPSRRPVVLAPLLLEERLNPRQVLGLVCAASAGALIALR